MRNKKEKTLSKKAVKETLTEGEHRLFLDGYTKEDLHDVYIELTDLENADLIDYFNLERGYGGDKF